MSAPYKALLSGRAEQGRVEVVVEVGGGGGGERVRTREGVADE